MKTSFKFSKMFHELSEAEWASPVFRRYGEFVSRHPYWLIIGSLLLTLSLSLGALKISVKDDLRFMYTPPGSASFHEFQVHKNFQRAHDQNLSYGYFYVAVMAPNGGNLLTESVSNLILKANSYIFNNLSLTNFLGGGGERVNFGRDLCPRLFLCSDSNKVVDVFLRAYFDPDDGYIKQNFTTDSGDPETKFTYPVAKIFGNPAFLASNFYDVRTTSNGDLIGVGLIHLTYFYPIRFDDDQEVISDFESIADRYFSELQSHNSNGIRFYTFSVNKLEKEVAQNTLRTLPYLPVSVVILVLYTLWTTIVWSNPVISKPIEGLMGVCTTLLAVISAFGLLFACGIPYNSTVAVVPFLTLALAVDDTYIMLAAWRDTNCRWNVEKRLGETLSSGGCAITVAMLTDVFAFVVGAFSNTPAIGQFCLFIAAAVMFDYIYQLTFFSAFLAISGHREESGKHCILFWLPADCAPAWRPRKVAPTQTAHSPDVLAAHKSSFLCCRTKFNYRFVDNYMENLLKRNYAAILLNTSFRIIALILYVIYVCLAFWGCVKLGVNLTPGKLLMQGSELIHYTSAVESYVWPQGLISIVYVQNAPDFDQLEERNRFIEFVEILENTTYSLGPQSTSLWFREYISFLHYLDVDLSDKGAFYSNLRSFLKLHDNQRWKRYIQLRNVTPISDQKQSIIDIEKDLSGQNRLISNRKDQSTADPDNNRSVIASGQNRSIIRPVHSEKSILNVDSFFFTTGFRLNGWPELLEMVQTWRDVCKNYSDYQAIIFEDNNFYADQIASLAPNVIQDTGIAFFCMIVAGAMFIPDALILFWVTWSLFSMNLGVIGLLALLGCDLDPTAVTSILLSIGLTVDFTIHVAYHYHKNYISFKKVFKSGQRIERRNVLEETLAAAGWPLIQGGLSTTLAVAALLFVPSYVIGVFLRTVLLVVLLGLLHALVYLPMLLTSVSLDRPRRYVFQDTGKVM